MILIKVKVTEYFYDNFLVLFVCFCIVDTFNAFHFFRQLTIFVFDH